MSHRGHAHRGAGMSGICCKSGIDLTRSKQISKSTRLRKDTKDGEYTAMPLADCGTVEIQELRLTASSRMVLIASSSSLL